MQPYSSTEDNLGLGRFVADRTYTGTVQLTSNKSRTAAHRFYERHGFAATHEGFKRYLG